MNIYILDLSHKAKKPQINIYKDLFHSQQMRFPLFKNIIYVFENLREREKEVRSIDSYFLVFTLKFHNDCGHTRTRTRILKLNPGLSYWWKEIHYPAIGEVSWSLHWQETRCHLALDQPSAPDVTAIWGVISRWKILVSVSPSYSVALPV